MCILCVQITISIVCNHPDEGSVGTVVKSISTLTARWFNLGLALGVSYDTLKQIESNYQRDMSRCQTEMIAVWLQDTSQPSWRILTYALRCPSVSGFNLATKIAKEHPSHAV